MRPHEKLDLWKKAVDLSVAIYKITEQFPREERFGLVSQIRRASVSIAVNVAEGAARRTSKEFLNFLSIAQGSASELETELLIARRLEFLSSEDYATLVDQIDEIARMVTGLSNYLRTKLDR